MDAIRFADSGIVLFEEAFGGLETTEMTIPYDDLDAYEIELEMDGVANLEELISVEEGNTPQLNLTALAIGEATVRESDAEAPEHDRQVTTEIDLKSRPANMPPVPDGDALETQTDDRFYDRLKNNPDSQPAVYRRLVRNEGEIRRRKFDNWCKRHGYDPGGGGHNASLLMLERLGEIERHGRGNDQRIAWTGE